MTPADHANTVATTLDSPKGILLRVERDEDGLIVHDLTGVRYGWGHTLVEAVAAWAKDVDGLLEMREASLGEPLLGEWRAYRKALA